MPEGDRTMENDTEEAKKVHAAALLHNLWIEILGRNTMEYTIGKAMRDCGFSDAESKDTTMQMRVRRMKKKVGGVATTEAPPVASVVVGASSPISTITEPSQSSSSSTAASARTNLLGNCRRSQQQVHAAYKAEFDVLTAENERFKRCTQWIFDQQQKHSGAGAKKGVAPLLKEYAEQNNISLSDLPAVRTIQQVLKDGNAGQTPPRKGRKGNIAEADFLRLGEAIRAHVALAACNGDEKSYCDLKKLVNSVANSKEEKIFPDRRDYTLIERIFKQFGIDLSADKLSRAEARRVLWTTKSNLENMFDQWRELVLHLEFALPKDTNIVDVASAVDLTPENIDAGHNLFGTGEVLFQLDQLRRIINLDETALSLDGLDGNRGGRPSLTFHDPSLPRTGKATSKCGYSATLVCGGNAAGEATPPHFQFPSTAQEQNQQMRFSTIAEGRDITAQFGHPAPTALSPSYGMNEKGGMDEAHFEKYLLRLMLQLFPDSSDTPGKRVLIKCDQGPGRSNLLLLARLRARGVYLFPSVPNSSSVTQEMDRLFGLFKSKVRVNLDLLHEALLKLGRSVSLGRDDCCKIVFGGEYSLDNETTVLLEEAFDLAFNRKRILGGFAAVGAAPLTRKCLADPKVRIEISLAAGENETAGEKKIRLLEEQLKACVGYLQLNGFAKANLLLVQTKRAGSRSNQRVTVPHSRERQLAILSANTIGAKYVAMEGSHLTHDDMFVAEEMRRRKEEIKLVEAEKKSRVAAANREKDALELIKEKEEENLPYTSLHTDSKKWKNPEIDTLLRWKSGGKVPPSKKEAKIIEWQRLKALPAPRFDLWTENDELKLQELKSNIIVEDTELGKERRRMIQETTASVAHMTEEQLTSLASMVDAARAAKSTATSAMVTTMAAETQAVEEASQEESQEHESEHNKSSNNDSVEKDGELDDDSSDSSVDIAPLPARFTRSRRTRLPAKFR